VVPGQKQMQMYAPRFIVTGSVTIQTIVDSSTAAPELCFDRRLRHLANLQYYAHGEHNYDEEAYLSKRSDGWKGQHTQY
jgi:hypothetical protein